MDIVTFDHLAQMHRKELESNLKSAKNIRNNLVRMVEEQIVLINQRAEQDKENITIVFTKLIADQELTITRTTEALGGYKSREQERSQNKVNEVVDLASSYQDSIAAGVGNTAVELLADEPIVAPRKKPRRRK